MAEQLDLADIQGNIVRGYGRYGFPRAHYLFFNLSDADGGRDFVNKLRDHVTTSERWNGYGSTTGDTPRPDVTLNVGFSWWGLVALDLPTRTLRAMPDEFIDGMASRSHILGDTGPSGQDHWDPLWQAAANDAGSRAHVWVSLNGQMGDPAAPFAALKERTEWLIELAAGCTGVRLLEGHKGEDPRYQVAAAITQTLPDGKKVPTAKEHFGYTDGIGDPIFTGQFPEKVEDRVMIGRGKLTPDQEWEPLATGEFLLGHADESQEIPPSAAPIEFTRNGTYMAYRKLHQNVASFQDYVGQEGEKLARVNGVEHEEAVTTLKAKMVGRWPDGIPLMEAPTYKDWQKAQENWSDIPEIQAKKATGGSLTKEEAQRLADYKLMLIEFKYADDRDGVKCPVSAHIRRANTRDMLDPYITSPDKAEHTGSSLNKRRRIIRRGLPYGDSVNGSGGDDGEHGIIFMAVCASLFRQFEFVQQQWMNYGLDFNVGNHTCPVIGNRPPGNRFVVAADPETDDLPYVCDDLPPFVTTRGGEYFFIPSLTALRMIAMGTVDPT